MAKRRQSIIRELTGVAPKVNRSMLRHQQQSPTLIRRTNELLEDEVGREALEEALELSATDPKSPAAVMLERLRDPSFANENISTAMRESGLILPEVLDILRQRDIALAIATSGAKIHSVLNGLGEAAIGLTLPCRGCDSTGKISVRVLDDEADPPTESSEPIDCLDCEGLGYLFKAPDIEAAKLFLEVHGLRKGAGGAGGIGTLNLGVGVQFNQPDRNSPEPITVKVQKILDGKRDSADSEGD